MMTNLLKIAYTIGKKFTIKNVFVGLAVVIVVSIAKHFIFGGLTAPFSFNDSIILGTTGLFTRLASTGLVEYLIDYHNLGNIIIYLLDSNKVTITGKTSYHMNANPASNRPGLTLTIPGGNGTGNGTGTGSVAGGNVPGGTNPLPAYGLIVWGDGFSEWGNPNQPAGCRANGHLQINDPNAQGYNGYNRNGTNQPFARHLGMALEHQLSTQRTRTISRYALCQRHQRFLVGHLYHYDINLYNEVVTATGNNRTIEIWKLRNSLNLRASLDRLM